MGVWRGVSQAGQALAMRGICKACHRVLAHPCPFTLHTAHTFPTLPSHTQSRLENHQHYVQGVAWDPLGHYVVSQSNDRTCRLYCPRPIPAAAGKKSAGAAAVGAVGADGYGAQPPLPACAVTAKELMPHATLSKATVSVTAGGGGGVTAGPCTPPRAPGVAGQGVGQGGGQGERSSLAAGAGAEAAAATAAATAAAAATNALAAGATGTEASAGAGAEAAAGVGKGVNSPSRGVAGAAPPRPQPLFLDESMASFFRRLAWSPEGECRVGPTLVWEASTCVNSYSCQSRTSYMDVQGASVIHRQLPGSYS